MAKPKLSTIDILKKFSFTQNSSAKLAILTSALSLILFFTIAFFSPFKDTLLSMFFPKAPSYATSTLYPSEKSIYADSLTNEWYNWSWSADINFFSTNIVRSGSYSIAFTPQGWGGLSPAMASGNLNISPFTNLRFYINGGTVGGQLLNLELRNGGTKGESVNINDFIEGGSIAANQWRKVDVPLNVLKGSSLSDGIINRIALQEASGVISSTVYIDDLSFYGTSTPSPIQEPTITPTQTPTAAPTVYPTITPIFSSPTIYSDSLVNGWANWSWSSNVDFSSSRYVYSGSKSVAFTANSGGGFSPALKNKTIDISPYNQISFYINGGNTGGQLYTFELRNGDVVGTKVPVSNYIEGGSIAANQWKKVTIPLVALKGSVIGNTIDRIALQSSLYSSQDTVYIDDIIFGNGTNIITPVPTNTVTPILTNTPRPTTTTSPVPTYTTTPVPTNTITIIPTQTLTPSPTIQACAVSTAVWSVSANPVAEGTQTNLNTRTSGNCDGKMVAFEVWAATGVGGIGDTRSRVTPVNTAIINNQAIGTWMAEYIHPAQTGLLQQVVSFVQNIFDSATANSPQYYFKAKIVDSDRTVTSADPKLSVNPATPPPTGSVVNIDAGNVIGTISPDFYGNNLTPYGGPSMPRNANYISKVAPLKYGTIRIPGGYEADGYRWWNGKMAVLADGGYMWTGTPPQLLDYLHFAESVGAKVMVTANYRTGTPTEAANWVEYMNSPVPVNPNPAWTTSSYAGNQVAPKGYFAWLRAQPGPTDTCKVCAGRVQPFGAKYWEIGNEIYYYKDGNNRLVEPTPERYTTNFPKFVDAMKAVDPSIKIGFVMEAYERYAGSWTDKAIKKLAADNSLGKVDFLVVHWYRYWDNGGIHPWGPEHLINPEYGHNDFVKYAGSYPKIAADWMRGLLEAASPGSSNRIELNMTEWGPNSGQPCDWDVLSIYSHLFAMRFLAEAQLAKYSATTYWNVTQGNDNYSMIQPDYKVGPIYWAFDMLRDFGRGGDKLISAVSGNPNVFAYASRLSNGSLSIMLLNNSASQTSLTINLAGFNPSGNANFRQYDQALLGTQFKEYPIHCAANEPQKCCTKGEVNRSEGPQTPPRQFSLNNIGTQFNVSLPADSSTIIVIPSSGSTITPTSTPVITQTITPTRTPTPTATPSQTPLPSGDMFPNKLISRGKQVSASAGDAASIVNGIYKDYGWRPGVPSASSPVWVAINIGNGPSKLLLNWTNTASYNYTDTGYGAPSDYIIQTSADSTNGRDGTWSNVVTIAGNNVRNRAHSFDFSGKSWVRMNITKAATGSWNSQYGMALDEIDIHDISRSSTDTWFFMGDSVVANANRSHQPDFASNINTSNNYYFPATINGGIANETSAQGVQHIDSWLVLNPDIKYWAINYGVNDSAGNTSNTNNFRNNMQTIINKIKAAGKVPVLSRIHYIPDGNHNNISAFNTVIDDLTRTNNLISGPDLYTWFYNHQNELGSDRLHPNSTGSVSINRLWAESMRGLYTSTTATVNASASTNTSQQLGIQSAIKTVQDFATQVIQLYTQP